MSGQIIPDPSKSGPNPASASGRYGGPIKPGPGLGDYERYFPSPFHTPPDIFSRPEFVIATRILYIFTVAGRSSQGKDELRASTIAKGWKIKELLVVDTAYPFLRFVFL